MSEPKDIPDLAAIPSQTRAEADAAAQKPAPVVEIVPSPVNTSPSYASRFASQRYHPVILIGSSNAGKTVLLLSLLAYFKGGERTRRLSVVFGDDLFKSTERSFRDASKNYFDRTVAEYIRGRTDQKTTIKVPMFVPAKVFGESQSDLKFAFMESAGEMYQPKEDQGQEYTPAFQADLASLLLQYPDGISFIWVAPHVPATEPRIAGRPQLNYDPELLLRTADESLRFAFANYTELRSKNSARDAHMLLVTKWDTYESKVLDNDIRVKLDRRNDSIICHEVESYLDEAYGNAYGAFAALKSPPESKVVFRYSAGSFDGQSKMDKTLEDLLRTYPRDIWNWLYDGMRAAHDWDLDQRQLIDKPAEPGPTLGQILQSIVRQIIG